MKTINKNPKKEIKQFLCHWPIEIHALVKMHSSLKCETINDWVIKAILEQLGRENNYIKDKKIKI